jgi:hypothetical protein
MERNHVAEADRHIAKARVARQQKIIRQMTLRGQIHATGEGYAGCLGDESSRFLKDTVSVSFLGPMPARS